MIDVSELDVGEANNRIDLSVSVNDKERRLSVSPCATLLDVLRDEMQLIGAKKCCDLGSCGACTVMVEGRRIYACLALAVMQDGKRIQTIEGLAEEGRLHSLQSAFVKHDAFQCGYCTPGQIMSAVGLMAEGRTTDVVSIREFMSGNLCRCGAYTNILAAICDAAGL